MTRVLVVLCIALGACGRLAAQNAPEGSPAEPQYIDTFSAVGETGNLIGLEHQTVTFHNRVRAVPGYASVKVISKFEPGGASVRVPASAQFVVRGREHVDPASLYELRPLKVSKNHREFVTTQGQGSIFTGARMANPDAQAVPVRFEHYGADSFRIIPEHPLPAGEYALVVRGKFSELYCFGVDR